MTWTPFSIQVFSVAPISVFPSSISGFMSGGNSIRKADLVLLFREIPIPGFLIWFNYSCIFTGSIPFLIPFLSPDLTQVHPLNPYLRLHVNLYDDFIPILWYFSTFIPVSLPRHLIFNGWIKSRLTHPIFCSNTDAFWGSVLVFSQYSILQVQSKTQFHQFNRF